MLTVRYTLCAFPGPKPGEEPTPEIDQPISPDAPIPVIEIA